MNIKFFLKIIVTITFILTCSHNTNGKSRRVKSYLSSDTLTLKSKGFVISIWLSKGNAVYKEINFNIRNCRRKSIAYIRYSAGFNLNDSTYYVFFRPNPLNHGEIYPIMNLRPRETYLIKERIPGNYKYLDLLFIIYLNHNKVNAATRKSKCNIINSVPYISDDLILGAIPKVALKISDINMVMDYFNHIKIESSNSFILPDN